MGCVHHKDSNRIMERDVCCRNNIKIGQKQNLNDIDLEFLEKQTSLSRNDLLHWFFEFKSRSPQLELDKDGFLEIYRQLRPNDPPYLVDKISTFTFRAFDQNNNGSISLSEFLVAYALLTRGDIRTKLNYCFQIYDADNNELIDKEELIPVINGMYQLLDAKIKNPPKAEDLADYIISKADVSHDGKISKEEFINALIAEPELQNILNPF